MGRRAARLLCNGPALDNGHLGRDVPRRGIVREVIYVAEPWDAAAWREPWVTRFDREASVAVEEFDEGVPYGLEAESAGGGSTWLNRRTLRRDAAPKRGTVTVLNSSRRSRSTTCWRRHGSRWAGRRARRRRTLPQYG